jgi:hypothetical protein
MMHGINTVHAQFATKIFITWEDTEIALIRPQLLHMLFGNPFQMHHISDLTPSSVLYQENFMPIYILHIIFCSLCLS